MSPDFYLWRQVSLLLQPLTRPSMHLSDFLENSTLRRVLNFFLPSRQSSLQMFWVSPGFSTQSDGSRMRNLSRQLKSVSWSSALILPQPCLLLFVLAPFSPSSWSSLSINSWCSRWSWNDWYWTNEEDCSTHHVWNFLWSICLLIGVWCRYLIWMFGSWSILWNNQSRATLWVLDSCLIVGLLPLIIISITASLSSKTYDIAPNRDDLTFDETWSTLFRSRSTCCVGFLVSHVVCGVLRQVSLRLLIFGFVDLIWWGMKHFNH